MKMILRTCDLEEFLRRTQGLELICFGAGRLLAELCDEFCELAIETRISYIADNNPALWGTAKALGGVSVRVVPPAALYGNVSKDTAVLISCAGPDALSVFDALDAKPELTETECYFAEFVREEQRRNAAYRAPSAPAGFRMNPVPVIPKTIHYCWVGGDPMPENNRGCIESWRRFCPDYEIVEWNENNYDFTKNRYMREAHQARKWGFVPDYARLDIVYAHGGVYLDTDVEIVRPLDDLLHNDAYCGFENVRHINLGLGFGSVAGFPLIGSMRDDYDGRMFFDGNGNPDLTPSPVLQTDFLLRHGLRRDGGFQTVEGMTVYPVEYFNPYSFVNGILKTTPRTHSIHWFDGSWQSKAQTDAKPRYRELYKLARTH
jgi:hypothetical protein